MNIKTSFIKAVSDLASKWSHYLKFSAVDIDTEYGRGQKRERRALHSGLVGLLSKLFSIAASLITIPLTLQYLGDERFGLWMAISSAIAMLAFADLGVGNGLVNAISNASGRDNHQEIKKYISSATIVLCFIGLTILLIFYGLYSHIEWASLLHLTSPESIDEAGPAALIFVIVFALNLPIGMVQRVQMGLQMGFLSNFWQILSSLLTLGAVLLVVHLKLGLPLLVLAQAGMPVAIGLMNGIVFFGGRFRSLAPNISNVHIGSSLSILKLGLLFFVLQIVGAMMYSSDSIIIARILGAQQVPIFTLTDKIFSFVSLIVATALMPLWPAYSEALSRGDIEWSFNIFKKSFIYSVAISFVLSISLIFFGESIIKLWIGRSVEIPISLFIGMGIWKVVESAGNSFAMFLNGANIVGMQVKIGLGVAIVAIFLKFQLVEKFGISGPVYGTLIAYTLFSIIPYLMFRKKILHKIKVKHAN